MEHLICAVVLTAGIAAYHGVRVSRWQRGLILLAFVAATYGLAWHATFRFWEMTNELGYHNCFPDGHGCAALGSQAAPWWVLFFSP